MLHFVAECLENGLLLHQAAAHHDGDVAVAVPSIRARTIVGVDADVRLVGEVMRVVHRHRILQISGATVALGEPGLGCGRRFAEVGDAFRTVPGRVEGEELRPAVEDPLAGIAGATFLRLRSLADDLHQTCTILLVIGKRHLRPIERDHVVGRSDEPSNRGTRVMGASGRRTPDPRTLLDDVGQLVCKEMCAIGRADRRCRVTEKDVRLCREGLRLDRAAQHA